MTSLYLRGSRTEATATDSMTLRHIYAYLPFSFLAILLLVLSVFWFLAIQPCLRLDDLVRLLNNASVLGT